MLTAIAVDVFVVQFQKYLLKTGEKGKPD